MEAFLRKIRSHIRSGASARSRGILGSLLVVALVGLCAVAGGARLALAQPTPTPVDQPADANLLTGSDVTAAFQAAGLNVQDVRREPIGGSPGSAPGSEQEAFTFVIDAAASPHPLTGRVMVFPNAQALKAKADWGQRIGSTFIQHRNILVWLDTDLDAQTAARFRQAINGMR
ncbi:MAG: hypothetical protein JOZ81_31215 [Chloroflexi bacterium]|nr:hypothetical protein [Chloroflexota bacterium]